MTGSALDESDGWHARPFLLAAIGAGAAFVVQQLLDTTGAPPAWRTALGCGIAVATLGLGFCLERRQIGWVLGFAAALGLVAGLILYWNNVPELGTWGDWRYAALILSLAITVPLFQVAHAESAWRFPYPRVHEAAWTNVVLLGAACVFTGITFALAWLLAGLFGLIGLQFLRDLLLQGWASAMLFGAAFGGALGLLRERQAIAMLLQRVVTAVLSVLAPVLAVGLVLFLCALPFTGLGALWEATKATTPILLACVIGALILANAVIGDGDGDEARNPVLRLGATALAAAMLPLVGIAALATGLRIQQYGFSPDRLWALVFVILASVYAVAYFGSVLRGRLRWAGFARDANLNLAFVVAGVALLLATPLLSFNAISTRDQVARLTSGKVSPDKFDWAALALDFGEPGKAAVTRLAGSVDARIAGLATEAASMNNRYQAVEIQEQREASATIAERVRILPFRATLPRELTAVLTDWNACGPKSETTCTLLYRSDATEAFVAQGNCFAGETAGNRASVSLHNCDFTRLALVDGRWRTAERGPERRVLPDVRDRLAAAYAAGQIEVRTVPRRQVFVGGVPVGDPFE